MEASWGRLGGLGGGLGFLESIWKPIGDVLGGLGGVLEAILAVLEASGGWRLLGGDLGL